MKNISGKVGAVFLFSLFVNLFFYHSFGNLAFVIFNGGLALLLVGLLGRFRNIGRYSPESAAIVLWLLCSYFQLWVGNPVSGVLSIVSLYTGYLFISYTLLRGYVPGGLMETLLGPLHVVGTFVGSGLSFITGGVTWKELWAHKKAAEYKGMSWRPYITGVVVGLPVIILLISMLSNADPIFASYVKKLVSEQVLRELPVRVMMTALVFMFFVPAAVMKLASSYASPLSIFSKMNWKREAATILGMVAVVMALFLAIQWPYVFVRVTQETSLSQYGVATYSEYVQKGFGELVKVALLVFVLSSLALLVYRSPGEERANKWLTIMQGIVGIEFVIFVISIVRRVMLYTEHHGLSLARIYGLVFLLWLVGMGVTLGMRYVARRGMLRWEALWSLSLLFIMMIINWEQLVLTNPPTVNGRVDYVYLSRLSPDGYDGWKQSYVWAKEVIEREKANKGLITRDSRREIQYAQWIMSRFRRTYEDYIVTHGTREEAEIVNSVLYYGRYDRTDRLYRWAPLTYSTYRRMHQDMPLSEVQALYDEAGTLMERIWKQPDGERDFDTDISTETPFL